METIEHFAKISLVARTLGRENLLSRDEVTRLQDLRGMYGISSPAPICADPAGADGADCQVVDAPSSPRRGSCPTRRRCRPRPRSPSARTERFG